MNQYLAEFVGTAILVLLGNGVVANVCLQKTKGHEAGWIVIAFGWGMAVFVAVSCVMQISGAHINPAVTSGLAAAGQFPWDWVAGFVAAQMLGGFAGAALVFLFYGDHYHATDDVDGKLGTFCTGPNSRNLPINLVLCVGPDRRPGGGSNAGGTGVRGHVDMTAAPRIYSCHALLRTPFRPIRLTARIQYRSQCRYGATNAAYSQRSGSHDGPECG